MNVWIVYEQFLEDEYLCGIYTTERGARERLTELEELRCSEHSEFRIEQGKLDSPLED